MTPALKPDYRILNPDQLVAALAATPANPWPTIDDRAAWEAWAATSHGRAIRDSALDAAHEAAEAPGVRLPTLSEHMLFRQNGDRATFETALSPLSERLAAFTLAACFTGEEEWCLRAADTLWSICELSSWVTPAHESRIVPDMDDPTVDLWAAMRAQEVAETVQLLGPALDRIHPYLRRRLRHELNRRAFDPYVNRDWGWSWPGVQGKHLNNWLAVCSGGVLLGALAALNDDPERQARVVRKAAWSLGFFHSTFGEKGSLDEGVSYWAYGMSYFVMAAERLAARTSGAMDPLADPIWREVAAFPLRCRLYGDTFVNFSDCPPQVKPVPGWMAWLGRRVGVSELEGWATRLAGEERESYRRWLAGRDKTYGSRHRYLPLVLRTLAWMGGGEGVGSSVSGVEEEGPSGPNTQHPTPSASFLPDVQWLVARSGPEDDALVLAAKGGHNDESHNHNDGGSFLVHWRQEPLVAELGAPTYTRQFFGPERYENIAARSLGHAVPFVNGCEQRAGREYRAAVLAREAASVSYELAGFYGPEAGLVSLRRDLGLRDGGVTLTDTAEFSADGATLSLALPTLDAAVVEVMGPGRARIVGRRGALLVTWPPEQAACYAEAVPTEDAKFLDAEGRTRLARLWFDVAVTGRSARLDLMMTPTEVGD